MKEGELVKKTECLGKAKLISFGTIRNGKFENIFSIKKLPKCDVVLLK